MSDAHTINPLEYLWRTMRTRYQVPKITATRRNKVRSILPHSPPNDQPQAIPSFSMKYNRAQENPSRLVTWPYVKFVLIQYFKTWSITRIIKISRAAYRSFM